MADAVGLAASILQIVSTGVQVSVYLYNFAETVSTAGKALKEISNDISFTTSVLEQLRETLESEKQTGTASKDALLTAQTLVNECSTIFEAILALIKKHFPEAGTSTRKRAKLNALKWPFIQPKIEVMRSNLEKHKTKLILMTQVLTFAKLAASERRSVESQLEQERQKLEALVIVSHRVKAQSRCMVNPFGLTEVYSPLVQASVDVVFIHGIFGHPKDTWTSNDADVFWPAELLPPVLEDEGTRILTYGYEAGAAAFVDGDSRHNVHEVIGSLGRDLASNRQIRKAVERPLIFVAHSLGGIIVKGVLAQSVKSQEDAIPNLRSISISTYGVVFLSTPHNLLASHIDLLCEAAIRSEICRLSHINDKLRAKHTALQVLNQEFLDVAHQYQLYCFREMLEPKVVDELSSRLSMLHVEATCIQTDHHNISKFGSDSAPGFDSVCAVIQNYVYRAPLLVSARWAEERTKARMRINVLISPNSAIVSPTAQIQYTMHNSCLAPEYSPRVHDVRGEMQAAHRKNMAPDIIPQQSMRTLPEYACSSTASSHSFPEHENIPSYGQLHSRVLDLQSDRCSYQESIGAVSLSEPGTQQPQIQQPRQQQQQQQPYQHALQMLQSQQPQTQQIQRQQMRQERQPLWRHQAQGSYQQAQKMQSQQQLQYQLSGYAPYAPYAAPYTPYAPPRQSPKPVSSSYSQPSPLKDIGTSSPTKKQRGRRPGSLNYSARALDVYPSSSKEIGHSIAMTHGDRDTQDALAEIEINASSNVEEHPILTSGMMNETAEDDSVAFNKTAATALGQSTSSLLTLDTNPSVYKCQYSGCLYQSKRESNCQQHMKKAHEWQYIRSKNNGKTGRRPLTERTLPEFKMSKPGSDFLDVPTSELVPMADSVSSQPHATDRNIGIIDSRGDETGVQKHEEQSSLLLEKHDLDLCNEVSGETDDEMVEGEAEDPAEQYEEPEAEAEPEAEKPDLSILKGLTLRQGNIIGPDGVPIARLIEGHIKELAGKKCDGEGQLWNNAGQVIGRVELIPDTEREAKADGPFAGLKDLFISKKGMVEDRDGNTIGEVIEGDPKKIIGCSVDEDGDIIDKYGNVKGHAVHWEEPEEEAVNPSALERILDYKAGQVEENEAAIEEAAINPPRPKSSPSTFGPSVEDLLFPENPFRMRHESSPSNFQPQVEGLLFPENPFRMRHEEHPPFMFSISPSPSAKASNSYFGAEDHYAESARTLAARHTQPTSTAPDTTGLQQKNKLKHARDEDFTAESSQRKRMRSMSSAGLVEPNEEEQLLPKPKGDEGMAEGRTGQLQGMDEINATAEEKRRAKEEVLELLKQWTTYDISNWVDDGRADVPVGTTGAMEIGST